ncbi:MAG TPA: lysophospholipid acyltransferase family protein [Nocardioides sp.]
MRDLTYPTVIVTAKTAFKLLGQRFQLTGTENVPRSGGVLLACNHVSYLDYIYAGFGAQPSKRLVRFMAKKEIFDHKIGGPVMRSFHHISVDRANGEASAAEAVRYLREGEAVGIFPEATISRSFEIKEIKSGATRIAAEAGVPLLPVIVWGTQRMMTKDHPKDFSRGKTIAISVGTPLHPTGASSLAEATELREAMAELLDRTIRAYPEDEQPPGSWWLPAKYGGSAPTPEEAAALDADERRKRAAARRAKR